jgi:hypothetical protein
VFWAGNDFVLRFSGDNTRLARWLRSQIQVRHPRRAGIGDAAVDSRI